MVCEHKQSKDECTREGPNEFTSEPFTMATSSFCKGRAEAIVFFYLLQVVVIIAYHKSGIFFLCNLLSQRPAHSLWDFPQTFFMQYQGVKYHSYGCDTVGRAYI